MRLGRWSAAILLVMVGVGLRAASAQESGEDISAQSSPAEEAPAMSEPAAAPEVVPAPAEAVPQEPSVTTPFEDRDMEWIWGEVVNVDPVAQEITIKHLDYDTYEEARTALSLDDKTAYENVEGLAQVKPGDHVTADYYKVGSRNMVELLVLEKDDFLTGEEPAAEASAPAVAAPEMPAAPEPVASMAQENPPVMLPSDTAPMVSSAPEAAPPVEEAPAAVAPASEAPSEPEPPAAQ